MLDPTSYPKVQRVNVLLLICAEAHRTRHTLLFSHLLFSHLFFFSVLLLSSYSLFLSIWSKYYLHKRSPDFPLLNMYSLVCRCILVDMSYSVSYIPPYMCVDVLPFLFDDQLLQYSLNKKHRLALQNLGIPRAAEKFNETHRLGVWDVLEKA